MGNTEATETKARARKAAPKTLTPEQAKALAAPSVPRTSGVTRVVVLGGGFAGVYTAKYLTEALGRRADVEVELLSEENYFVFQPLLPEVAAGGIAATHVVNPIRELVPRARFRCCKVRSVDFENKRVLVTQGEGLDVLDVPYDHLVFCLGKVSNFSSLPGVAEHALAMKDLGDAFRLRNHVIRSLELADIEPDPDVKRALLTFVVAGGGFSGVETIGELHELVSRSLEYFPSIDPREVSFQLVHAGDVILPEMPKDLGVAARKILEERGIEMVLNARVKAASKSHVYLSDGSEIATRTFVCTVGNAPNPIAKHALESGGFEEGKMNGRGIGVFAVDEHLRCVGKANYWAVGDCAGVPNVAGKGLCPPTAQFAIREAKACARNIVATIDGGAVQGFRFEALGMLASLGERSAVAVMLGVKLTGFLAWFAWRTVYLSKLPGFVRRLRVALDWTLDLFFPRDITQLQVFRHERLDVHHYEPGEEIIRKGQVGRELYMISSGDVEVIDDDGAIVASLGPKDVFGEKALLEDTPRTASVRAKNAVQVVVMSRGDFRAVVSQFPILDDYFASLLRQRYPALMKEAPLMERVADEPKREAPKKDVATKQPAASRARLPESRVAPIRRWLLGLADAIGKPLGLALLRVVVGFYFAISGWGKLHALDKVTHFFTELKIPFPHAQAVFIANLEFFGGLAIVIGLATRVSAFLLSNTMVVAILTAKLPDLGKDVAGDGVVPTLKDKFFSFFTMDELLLFAMFVILVVIGPGVLSIDHFIGKAIGGEPRRTARA